MVALETPICDFGWNAPDFDLIGTDGKNYQYGDIKGPNGTLVMFICNHCPYVKSVIGRIVEDCNLIKDKGIGIIAIMSNDVNDPKYGTEDSFENMKLFAKNNKFTFFSFIEKRSTEKNSYFFGKKIKYLSFSNLKEFDNNFTVSFDDMQFADSDMGF